MRCLYIEGKAEIVLHCSVSEISQLDDDDDIMNTDSSFLLFFTLARTNAK